jgi:hypothetical protein
MEISELKNTWTVLEEQLKKNEMLNKQIVQEMVYKQSNKSLNRLINVDFMCLIVMLLMIPVCIWLYKIPGYENILSIKILCGVMVLICISAAIWYGYKLKNLTKINFSKEVKQNMYAMNKYIIMLKKEKLATYFVLAPILGLLSAFCYYELKANFALWIFLIVVLTVAIVAEYWLYKRFYDTNILSIRKSLDEMKELEEEL